MAYFFSLAAGAFADVGLELGAPAGAAGFAFGDNDFTCSMSATNPSSLMRP
jgi:hypothetical protein